MGQQRYSHSNITFKLPWFGANEIWYAIREDRFLPAFRDRLRSHDRFVFDLTGDSIDRNTITVLKNLLAQEDLDQRVTFVVEMIWPGDEPDPKVIFFSRSFYKMSLWETNNRPGDISINGTRRHKISCLNRMSRPQRLYVFYRLFHKNYFKSSLISCRGLVDSYTGSLISLDDAEYQELPLVVRRFFLEKNTHWESIPEDINPGYDMLYFDTTHPAYAESSLNIVTEGSVSDDSICLSEKICKPLKSQQLFTLVGDRGAMDHLRAMGFECFDQDFDFHIYDRKFRWLHRVDSMLELIDEKYQYLDQIYHDNHRELMYNRQWFCSNDFREKLLQDLHLRDLII